MKLNLNNNQWGLLILVICVLALVAIGLFCLITGKTLEGASMVVGALIAFAKDLMGYFWGSSLGSKDKDERLAQLLGQKLNGGS